MTMVEATILIVTGVNASSFRIFYVGATNLQSGALLSPFALVSRGMCEKSAISSRGTALRTSEI